MKYKLINPINKDYSTIEQILFNRGVKEENFYHYLNTTDEDINSPILLGEDKLRSAAAAILNAVLKELDTLIIVDPDCDGMASSSLLLNYLYDTFPSFIQNHVHWFIHEQKVHGLSDCVDEAMKHKLIIIPDAGSNDYKECKKLSNNGITVIVLDHHEIEEEKESKDAILINNQSSEYPNKFLSGVGVTWQFCRYLDKLLKNDNADKYLDLVALGNCADMESMLSIETKHLINKGFEPEAIKNPFIFKMWEKNKFKLGERITFIGAAFYIAPFVNAMVRSGTQEEKEILFRSLLTFKAFEEVPSSKRGHMLGEKELLVDQAIRICTNVKNRQTKAQDTGLELIEHIIVDNDMMEHKVLLFLLEPNLIDKNIIGLIANKIMAKYQRPCCILTKVEETVPLPFFDEDADYWNFTADVFFGDWEKGTYVNKEFTKTTYQGSARGCDKAGIINFKDICISAPGVTFVAGHQGAFGLGIEANAVSAFLEYTDEVLKDMSSEPIYYVDYIFNENNVDVQKIIDIASLGHLWGKDFDEPLVLVKNIRIIVDNLTLMKSNTLKIDLGNINIIKFNCNNDELSKLYSEDGYVEINAICRCNLNEWNGNISGQLFLEDYEIIDSAAFVI